MPRNPRIISLVPSQTELLFDLGIGDQVIGVTKFCIHPHAEVKRKAKIGGTKKFHFETIDELQPDLIIGNKEENYQEGIEVLKQKYPVWMSDITTLEQAIEMIKAVGDITGTKDRAMEICTRVRQNFDNVKKQPPRRVIYFIWKKPYMAVGNDTFINEMLARLGLINIASDLPRYPELTPLDIKGLNPDLILLSSEPYPFKEKHFNEFKEICPAANVRIVDGEMFSWYGSRLLKAVDYFNHLQL